MNKRYITQLGQQTADLVARYGLDGFYDIASGHINIPTEDISAVYDRVLRFIKDHTEWIVGYQGDMYYIIPKEDI